MKKSLLILTIGAFLANASMAQSLIFDNGPLFDLPGAGSGGANVSSLHDGQTSYGTGHAVSSGYRVADDLVIPAGETWMIDSLVFFAYQTGSGNTSSITEVNVQIWSGDPSDVASTIVFGDNTTNRMITTEWTGIYRTGDFGSTTCDPATCVQRPIMRNATMIGVSLGAGTYWIDWQTNGSGTSGPWCPPVNLGLGNTITGNAKQYDPTALVWNDLVDIGNVGMPFHTIGTVFTSVEEIQNNNKVSVFPNPVIDRATVTINIPVSKSNELTFKVFDILGHQVMEMNNITSQSFDLNRGTLTGGVYFYEMTQNGDVLKNGKIVLQ